MWVIVISHLMQVKSLRGHKAKIKSVVVIGGRDVDWEDVRPPVVVSLSEDRCVRAWDLLEVRLRIL